MLSLILRTDHFRFFPESDRDAERSGNVKAGTVSHFRRGGLSKPFSCLLQVIDRDITDPTSWDWYLQSHGGLLGTSRSTHYTVLLGMCLLWVNQKALLIRPVDENNFSADKITSLTCEFGFRLRAISLKRCLAHRQPLLLVCSLDSICIHCHSLVSTLEIAASRLTPSFSYYAHHACVRAKLLSQPTNDDAHSSFSNASRGSQESAERAKVSSLESFLVFG